MGFTAAEGDSSKDLCFHYLGKLNFLSFRLRCYSFIGRK